MATKFSTIYDRAVFKFKDYSFLKIIPDYKEAILQQYLLSAVADFAYVCDVDLEDIDLDQEQFNQDLSNEIIEILALGIAYHWLSGQILSKEHMRNLLHNKDYTSYSPGNLLGEMRSLREEYAQEYRGKINGYSVRHADIANRKV